MIALEEGSVVAGRYRLGHELARGGMGAVWVAQHLQLDIPVAIKFMDPAFASSADARARFEREAKAAAKLQSPHVVQVHDYGVEDGMPFIAMELLQGEDLGARLAREGRMTLRDAAVVVRQICKALRRAHEAGIVHRDLKPSNVFLARHHEEDVVKVLDFGIAKANDATKVGSGTRTGMLIGSPHYMSPEQARGSKQLDHRSDLWSIGVIVFEMLTGATPFPGEEIGEVIMAICADPIPVPSAVAPHLGPEVDRFFERALARDVAARFQSARELADAFVAVAGGGEEMASLASFSARAPSADDTPNPARPSLPSLPTPRDAATAPTQESPRPIQGTLAPTGHSLAVPAHRGARSAVIAAIGLSCAAIVGAAFLLRPSTHAPAAATAHVVSAPPAPPSAAASVVTPAAPTAIDAVPTAIDAAPTAAPAAPEPAPSASAKAAAAAPAQRPPVGKAAVKPIKKEKNSVLGF